jgi:hypothetical protein
LFSAASELIALSFLPDWAGPLLLRLPGGTGGILLGMIAEPLVHLIAVGH